MSYRFVDRFLAGTGMKCISILFLFESLSTNMYDIYHC